MLKSIIISSLLFSKKNLHIYCLLYQVCIVILTFKWTSVQIFLLQTFLWSIPFLRWIWEFFLCLKLGAGDFDVKGCIPELLGYEVWGDKRNFRRVIKTCGWLCSFLFFLVLQFLYKNPPNAQIYREIDRQINK